MKQFAEFVLRSSILLATILIATACNVEKISQNQHSLARYAVQIKDLPDGWQYVGEDWGIEYGGDSYLRGFGVKDNTIIRFAHTISMFSDTQHAIDAYSKRASDEFGTMKPRAEANFMPSDSNDEFRFECEQVLSEIDSCIYLQRHNQFVTYVYVNINDKYMTFPQLNEVLKILDERLNKVSMDK